MLQRVSLLLPVLWQILRCCGGLPVAPAHLLTGKLTAPLPPDAESGAVVEHNPCCCCYCPKHQQHTNGQAADDARVDGCTALALVLQQCLEGPFCCAHVLLLQHRLAPRPSYKALATVQRLLILRQQLDFFLMRYQPPLHCADSQSLEATMGQ